LLRYLRERKKLSQEQLGELVGMTYHGIGQRERDAVRLKPSEWPVFAKALGVSEDVFAEAAGNQNPEKRLIPLVGAIPAGWSKVVTHHEGGDYVPAYDIQAERCFACVVKGDSMEPAMREGDIAVFRDVAFEGEEELLRDGRVVAVTFANADGEVSLCRMKWVDAGSIRLLKDNPKYRAKLVKLDVEHVARLGVLVQHRKGWA